MLLTIVQLLCAILLTSLPTSLAHIQVSNPPPRGSQYNPLWTGPIDYDIMAPSGPSKPFPCQGKPSGDVVRTIAAGTSLSVNFLVGANHDGGHCQFAFSYDEGTTWVVVHTITRSCFQQNQGNYVVPIPSSMPPCEKCIFAWTWINAMGNREFYMNCVDVKITGNGNAIAGPRLFVANLPGYTTIPEFFGDRNDYRTLLDSRPIITVYGSGTTQSTTTTSRSTTTSLSTTPRSTTTTTPRTTTPRSTTTSLPSSPSSTSTFVVPTKPNMPPTTTTTTTTTPRTTTTTTPRTTTTTTPRTTTTTTPRTSTTSSTFVTTTTSRTSTTSSTFVTTKPAITWM
jgi:hypothetical protein